MCVQATNLASYAYEGGELETTQTYNMLLDLNGIYDKKRLVRTSSKRPYKLFYYRALTRYGQTFVRPGVVYQIKSRGADELLSPGMMIESYKMKPASWLIIGLYHNGGRLTKDNEWKPHGSLTALLLHQKRHSISDQKLARYAQASYKSVEAYHAANDKVAGKLDPTKMGRSRILAKCTKISVDDLLTHGKTKDDVVNMHAKWADIIMAFVAMRYQDDPFV